VSRPEDIGEAVRVAIGQDKPAVIDVVIDKAESMRQAIYSPLALEAASGIRPAGF
jgi:thiamine pyrophosphate-dependent acetolactate synthase large subunit-like protein